MALEPDQVMESLILFTLIIANRKPGHTPSPPSKTCPNPCLSPPRVPIDILGPSRVNIIAPASEKNDSPFFSLF